MSIVQAQITSQPHDFKEDDLHTFLEKRKHRLGMISSKRMIENTLQIYLQRYKKQKDYYIEFRKPIHESNDDLNLLLDKMRIDEDETLSIEQTSHSKQSITQSKSTLPSSTGSESPRPNLVVISGKVYEN